jgi:hypothetical protein
MARIRNAIERASAGLECLGSQHIHHVSSIKVFGSVLPISVLANSGIDHAARGQQNSYWMFINGYLSRRND